METQTSIIPLLKRICNAVEGLREDLRPELRKTETLKRLKREEEALRRKAEEAVRKFIN